MRRGTRAAHTSDVVGARPWPFTTAVPTLGIRTKIWQRPNGHRYVRRPSDHDLPSAAIRGASRMHRDHAIHEHRKLGNSHVPVPPGPLQDAAPGHEIGGITVRVHRRVTRPRNPAHRPGRDFRPSRRPGDPLAGEQRCRHAERAIRARDEDAGLESGCPISAKDAGSFGVRRLGASARRHLQIEHRFPAGGDVYLLLRDLGSEPCSTRAVRLESRAAGRKSIESVATRGVSGVAAVASGAPDRDARVDHRRSADAVGNGAPQGSTPLRRHARRGHPPHCAGDR